MAHKTQFKHKACGTELRMDADLEDRFYSDPTSIVKIYCPTCKSLFACSGFAWVDNDLPVVPGSPDNELPEGSEPPLVDNSLPETGTEVPPEASQGDERPDQGLPGDQPEVDNSLPEGEAPVDPGYDLGTEAPNQDLPGAQPGPDQGLPPSGGSVDNELPEPNPNPNPNPDVDVDVDVDADRGSRPEQGLPGEGASPKR